MSESPIKVLAVKPISYKAQILLIEVEGKKFLVGYSDKGFNLLGEIKHDG
jgi:flagellar protein FliO/FliZ